MLSCKEWIKRTISVMLVTGAVIGQGISPSYASLSLEEQRNVYDQAQKWLDNKDASQYLAIRSQLMSYPLTPYLDYRTFLLDLEKKTPDQVERFIYEYRNFPFAGRIRKPYMDALADHKQWQRLLTFSPKEPRGEANRCDYFTAHWHQGDKSLALAGGEALWLQGHSISDRCDVLFTVMKTQGLLTDTLYLQRIELAYQAGNPSLMKYLSRQIQSQGARKQAQEFLSLYRAPERVSRYLNRSTANQQYLTAHWPLINVGLEKLSRVDPEQTASLLNRIKSYPFSSQQRAIFLMIQERTAARLIGNEDSILSEWSDYVLEHSKKSYYLIQRVRAAIKQNDWQGVHHWISLLPQQDQQENEWQYWLGRAQMALGERQFGGQRLFKILGQRDFYSVSAANWLNKPVSYPIDELEYQPELVSIFSVTLTRIHELIARDKYIAARSEWYWLLRRADKKQKAMLAQYAVEQQWSHFSVAASIKGKLWGNIALRFPITHLESFKQFASEHQLNPVTLMSLARQESALDSMAHSPVGARGLMQVMPRTARYTAKKYQLHLANTRQLYRADKNIEIGSQYFAELMARYDNNRVLALAAYNAGPNRVDRWLNERGGVLDVFQFIESIPFKETRRYVKNILMFETYYRSQLGVDAPFLKEIEINTKY